VNTLAHPAEGCSLSPAAVVSDEWMLDGGRHHLNSCPTKVPPTPPASQENPSQKFAIWWGSWKRLA